MITLSFLYFNTHTPPLWQDPPFRSVVRWCSRCSVVGIQKCSIAPHAQCAFFICWYSGMDTQSLLNLEKSLVYTEPTVTQCVCISDFMKLNQRFINVNMKHALKQIVIMSVYSYPPNSLSTPLAWRCRLDNGKWWMVSVDVSVLRRSKFMIVIRNVVRFPHWNKICDRYTLHIQKPNRLRLCCVLLWLFYHVFDSIQSFPCVMLQEVTSVYPCGCRGIMLEDRIIADINMHTLQICVFDAFKMESPSRSATKSSYTLYRR